MWPHTWGQTLAGYRSVRPLLVPGRLAPPPFAAPGPGRSGSGGRRHLGGDYPPASSSAASRSSQASPRRTAALDFDSSRRAGAALGPPAGGYSPRTQQPPPGRAGEPAPRGLGVVFAGKHLTLLCRDPRPRPRPRVRGGRRRPNAPPCPPPRALPARCGRGLARGLLRLRRLPEGGDPAASGRRPGDAGRRGGPQRRAPARSEPGRAGGRARDRGDSPEGARRPAGQPPAGPGAPALPVLRAEVGRLLQGLQQPMAQCPGMWVQGTPKVSFGQACRTCQTEALELFSSGREHLSKL